MRKIRAGRWRWRVPRWWQRRRPPMAPAGWGTARASRRARPPGGRGCAGWQIDVKARSAHSSQIFTDEVGAGAIYELARILHTFYEELHGEELLTFNPGLIAGSTQLNFDPKVLHAETFGKDNIVAPVAVATGDLRTISSEQLERTKERMRKIVAASLPGASATITFSDS